MDTQDGNDNAGLSPFTTVVICMVSLGAGFKLSITAALLRLTGGRWLTAALLRLTGGRWLFTGGVGL